MKFLSKGCVIAVLHVLLSFLAIAQDSNLNKRTHRFILNGTVYRNINLPKDNERTVLSEAGSADNIFRVHDQNFYQVGFEYEYKTKKNITLSPSINYGEFRYKYEWDFRLKEFDKTHNMDFDAYKYVYQRSIPYVTVSTSLGYQLTPIRKHEKLKVAAKVGLGYRHALEKISTSDIHYAAYGANDTLFISQFGYTDYLTRRMMFFYKAYLGAICPVNARFIKDVRFGIEFTHSIAPWRKASYMNLMSGWYYNSTGDMVAHDLYLNRFRNLALSIGIGF